MQQNKRYADITQEYTYLYPQKKSIIESLVIFQGNSIDNQYKIIICFLLLGRKYKK